MTYPADFTDPTTVFGDLADLAIYPVTAINNVAGEWRFSVTFGAGVPDVAANTPLVYSYPAAGGDYEIVTVLSCNRASGYIAVTRAQEGTIQMGIGIGAYLVQEPTAATYTALKNLLLLTQKYSGRMGTVLPATCDPGMFFFKTDTGAFYACFETNIWTRLDLVDHGALSGLADAGAHTIYYTLAQAMAWHAALTKTHLISASTHDHSNEFAGAALPFRHLRCGPLASRPAVQHAGDIYIALDTKELYFSRAGSTWELYSTVPRGMIMLFAGGSCPTGWIRQTQLDNKFLKGAPGMTWAGLGSGGSSTHKHALSTLVNHTHTIAAYGATSSQASNHSHNVTTSYGTGGSTSATAFEQTNTGSTDDLASGSDGGHTHSVTFGAATTTSAGVASPQSDDADGRPPYMSMLFCRKS